MRSLSSVCSFGGARCPVRLTLTPTERRENTGTSEQEAIMAASLAAATDDRNMTKRCDDRVQLKR